MGTSPPISATFALTINMHWFKKFREARLMIIAILEPPQLYGSKIGREHRRDANDDQSEDHPMLATI
jgi:hypothetical protein